MYVIQYTKSIFAKIYKFVSNKTSQVQVYKKVRMLLKTANNKETLLVCTVSRSVNILSVRNIHR